VFRRRNHHASTTPAPCRRVDHHDRCGQLAVAIDDDALELHYQPVVDLERGIVVGLEALVRWPHPELGMLTAGAFVPEAESCGLIQRLDDWVLATACRQIAAWQDDVLIAPGFRVAINLSGYEFADHQLPDRVARALASSGADPECLTVELTETFDLVDVVTTHRSFRSLQQLGVNVSLDDFGTAFATFQRLRYLPFDEIKLDREVMASAGTAVGTAFINAAVELGRSLGMRTVAEGIETVEQAQLARSLGFDKGQGYLWSASLPAAAIADLLVSGNLPEPAACVSSR
jgi:EAL domain-containing protein (putative c-di-GMP-specific phosphodiesterase class I)